MSLYKQILKEKPDFSEEFPLIKPKNHIWLCNFEKENTENEKLFSRNLPLDNIKKNQISPPIYYNNSIYKYREQTESEVFPPKTEVLIKDKSLLSGNYPKKYLEQNFVNIDDESFLFNIDKPLSTTHDRNIKNHVTKELVSNSSKSSVISPVNFDKLPKTPQITREYDYSKFKPFNPSTRRSIIN